jgi:hypothetical protein
VTLITLEQALGVQVGSPVPFPSFDGFEMYAGEIDAANFPSSAHDGASDIENENEEDIESMAGEPDDDQEVLAQEQQAENNQSPAEQEPPDESQ